MVFFLIIIFNSSNPAGNQKCGPNKATAGFVELRLLLACWFQRQVHAQSLSKQSTKAFRSSRPRPQAEGLVLRLPQPLVAALQEGLGTAEAASNAH